MTDDELEREIWRQLAVRRDEAQPIITKYTVALYAWQDEIKIAGTGVLLRVADKRFLISAAHVLDLTFIHNFLFYTTVVPNDPAPLIPLRFVKRSSTARRKDMDVKDGELRDSIRMMLRLPNLKRRLGGSFLLGAAFFQLGDLDPVPLQKASGIMVFGFPQELAVRKGEQSHLDVYPLPFITTPLQCEPEERDHNKDILLYYPENLIDEQGVLSPLPDAAGLSGCGIWRLSQPPAFPIETPLSELRLVGIQHRWRSKSRYLVGSSVYRVLDMLYGGWPELRPALSLIRSPADPCGSTIILDPG